MGFAVVAIGSILHAIPIVHGKDIPMNVVEVMVWMGCNKILVGGGYCGTIVNVRHVLQFAQLTNLVRIVVKTANLLMVMAERDGLIRYHIAPFIKIMFVIAPLMEGLLYTIVTG